MTDPSNWRSWNSSFIKLAFQCIPRNFLVYVLSHSWYSFAYPNWSCWQTFSIMFFFSFVQFLLHSCFCFFTEKTSILVSFSLTLSTFFFLNLHIAWKWFFLYRFSQTLGIFPFLFHVHVQNTNIILIFFLTCKYWRIFVHWIDFYNGCISVLILVSV